MSVSPGNTDPVREPAEGPERTSEAARGLERLELDVPRFPQPDDVTCGPTCLLQVMRFYGDDVAFERLVELTSRNPDGGTLAVYLALTALRLGYRARITSFNLRVFDPTWAKLDRRALRAKLLARARAVTKPKLRAICRGYAAFLRGGGEVRLDCEPSTELIVAALRQGRPLLCGLNATFLYRQPRERPEDDVEDDVAGHPVGHFLVVCGYEEGGRRLVVRDPGTHVPHSPDGRYVVRADRLLHAVLLGIVSYDAVLLELWPEASA